MTSLASIKRRLHKLDEGRATATRTHLFMVSIADYRQGAARIAEILPGSYRPEADTLFPIASIPEGRFSDCGDFDALLASIAVNGANATD